MENNLPKGWTTVELKHLGQYINGRAFKANEWRKSGLPIIRIQNLNNPDATFNFSDKTHEEKYLIKNGELLMAWSASLGVYLWTKQDAWLNQHIFKVIPNQELTTKKFLYYALKEAIQEFYEKTHGSGIVHITKPVFESHKIPLPPLGEQQRIVAKLDELMAKIDRSRARLERIPKILKRFRQSVLSTAVSGSLTEEWRSERAKDDWPIVTLDSLCDPGRGISYGVIKLGDTVVNGVPCLRTSDVRPLLIDTTNVKRISKEISDNYKRTILRGNEVLINVRGTLGGVAVVNKDLIGWNISREVAIAPLQDNINPYFIAFYIASLESQNWLSEVSKGVAYTGINLADLRNLPISLPEKDEQDEIVRRIKQLFLLADKIESRYSKAKAQLNKLPQSLLAKAFRGELVRQDENDEPASVLLQKIKAEKASALARKSKSREYIIDPVANFALAAESNGSYQSLQPVNIPENKKAFAKQVLGGKIVSLFKDDPNFTHIKFQKIQYLAEHLAEVDLNWNYYSQSAGPYDPKFMHTVAVKLKASKWFEERKYKFHPLEKADKIEGYFDGYFKPAAAKLASLFAALKNSTEDEAEIVATLYAVWNNMIIKKEAVNDDRIVSTFFEWSDRKKKYTQQQVTRALVWMKKNGFVPTGFGKVIKEKEK